MFLQKMLLRRLGGWVVKFKGMKVEFKAFEELGNRVKEVTVNGEKSRC